MAASRLVRAGKPIDRLESLSHRLFQRAAMQRTDRAVKKWAAWTVERAVSDRPGAVPSKSPREKHPFADPTAATQKQTSAKRCAGETHTGRHGACRVTINPLHTHADVGLTPTEAASLGKPSHNRAQLTARQARNRFQVVFSWGTGRRSKLCVAAATRRGLRANVLRKTSAESDLRARRTI